MRDAVVLKGLTPDLPDGWNQDEVRTGNYNYQAPCDWKYMYNN